MKKGKCNCCSKNSCEKCEWYKEIPIIIDGKIVAVEIKCTKPKKDD